MTSQKRLREIRNLLISLITPPLRRISLKILDNEKKAARKIINPIINDDS